MSTASADALRYLGALATVVVGAVHVQHYADFIADVPTIGVLFVLNGSGAGLVALLLTTRRAVLGALGGVVLSAAALISVLISMTDAGLLPTASRRFARRLSSRSRRRLLRSCCCSRGSPRGALLGASASISPRPDPAPPLTARERQRAVN